MTDTTPRLALDYVAANQAQKHVTVNGDLWRLDALVQMAVVSRSVVTAPADPADGEAWLLPSAPVGADWSAFEAGDVVRRDGSLWVAVPTPPGAVAWVADEGELIVLTPDGWRGLGGVLHTVGPLTALGVGTDPDPDAPLVVRAATSRFEADASGDHRLTVNRDTGADTASLLFQTGFSGRAEIGLCGALGLAVRTSTDGTTWRTAIKTDPAGLTGINTETPDAVLHVKQSAFPPCWSLATVRAPPARTLPDRRREAPLRRRPASRPATGYSLFMVAAGLQQVRSVAMPSPSR